MTAPIISSIVAEIRAAVEDGIERGTAPMRARIVEMGQAFADQVAKNAALEARCLSLEERLAASEARIEQVAKEPRVHINPEFIVPTPAVHVSPNIQLPARKPTNKTFTKQPDGSFKIEEREE
jgi:hypothetical protein